MKKSFLLFIAVLFSTIISAQTIVFHENFEAPSYGDSLISTADSLSNPTSNFRPWATSTNLVRSGFRSDSNTLQPLKTIYLTSTSFSTVGNTYVILSFSQICKLFFTDGGFVEVSTDNGVTWITLTPSQYLGTGNIVQNKFSENAYNDWLPGDTLTKPTNSWWKDEQFDISSIVSNQSNVKIRFRYYSTGSATSAGRYGWLLDNVKVTASPCELNPPTVNPYAWVQGNISAVGPYTISAYIKDQSRIDSAYIQYQVGSGPFINLKMIKLSTPAYPNDSAYSNSIPFPGWGKTVNYRIIAVDSSCAYVQAYAPTSGYYTFTTLYNGTGLPLDAGITQITAPTGGVAAGALTSVQVKLKNFGTHTLKKATIHTTYNGIEYHQLPLHIRYDSLVQNAVSVTFTADTISTLPPGLYSLKVWAEQPNDSLDQNNINDTAYATFFVCSSLFNGNYTIGGTPGPNNYSTFGAVITGLSQCGVSGPTVFNVAPGTYAEQLVIPVIPGTSSTNTVTFQATNGDSTSVILTNNSSSPATNYLLKFTGGQYITFKSMTFSPSNTTYASSVVIGNNSNNLSFISNVFLGVQLNTDTNQYLVRNYPNAINSSITFLRNYFKNGNRGLSLTGISTTNLCQNIVVKYNTFYNQLNRNANFLNINALDFGYNTINNDASVNTGDGIYLTNVTNQWKFYNNRLIYAAGTRLLSIATSSSTSGNEAIVANNQFSLSGTGALHMVDFAGGSNFVKFIFNNFNGNSTAATYNVFWLNNASGTSSNLFFENNIFKCSGTGFGKLMNMNYAISGTGIIFDYNDYYTNNPNFGTINPSTVVDLMSWKALTGQDVNSVNIDPYYTSITDLHEINGLLWKTGTSGPSGMFLTNAPVDIDGQIRPNPPCIGADEFIPSSKDAALIASMQPIGGCGLSSTSDVKVVIKNIGSAAITPNVVNAVYKINNSNPISPELINRTINPGDTIQYTFSTKANLSVQTTAIDSTFNFKIWVNLTGDSIHNNDTINTSFVSRYIPQIPIVNDTIINYATTATLQATSPYTVNWMQSLNSGSYLFTGNNYTTPIIYAKDTFYVEANTGFSKTVIVGTGTVQNSTTSYPTPYGQYYNGSKEQYLILASELSALGTPAGPIQSIAFDVVTPISTTLMNYTIRIGATTQTSMTTSFINGLTTVYTNSSYNVISGLNYYNFSTPFIWDGVSNLVIEACFDNYPNGFTTNAVVNQTTTTFTSTINYHSDGGSVCPNTTGTTYNQRPNIKIIVAKLGCPSPRKPVIVSIGPLPPVDAGLLAVTSPSGTVPAGTSQPIVVKLKNYGSGNITSANIIYKINGVLQTPVYSWSGNIAHDSIKSVTIANHTFNGGLYTIQAWVSNPNGVSGTIASNDTAITTFTSCLNGTYTIGDTTSGLVHDFPTFNSAVSTLIASGICGNVIFNVDTGTYNEQVAIPLISGVSSSSTITFKAANNVNTSAKLQFNATSTTSSYTLQLNGANYIIFKNLTLRSAGVNYGHVIELVNGSNNNTFDNNIIDASVNNSTYFCGIYSNGINNNNNKITNNQIKKGYYSIYLNATSANHSTNNLIINNNLNGFYYYGIYSYYNDSISILNNTITGDSTSGYIYGIYAYYNNNILGVSKNKIDVRLPYTYAYGSCYGIYNYYCSGLGTNYNLTSNNFILVSGGASTSTSYGIYSNVSISQKYYYNTIKINSPSAYAFYLSGGNSDYIINNNFINSGGGYSFYTNTPASISNCDYNNYYTLDTNFVYWNVNTSNLNSLVTTSGMNQHSITANPQFISPADLHLLSTLLSGLGTPLTEVTDDIDGQTRSTTSPTIGADEVPMIPKDAGVTFISTPNAIETEGNSIPIKVAIRNFGTDTIHSMSIKYKVNNGTAINFNYVGSLPKLGIDTVVLPNMIVPAGNASICAYTALTGDTNYFNDQYCKNFFGTPLFDAQLVTAIPPSGGCNLTTDTIKVKIKNLGINTINGNISVSYKIVGGSNVVTQNVTSILNTGDSLTLKFSTPINLVVTTKDSTYLIKTWVTLLNDHIKYNDTAYASVQSLHTPPQPTVTNVTIPYGTPVTLNANSATNDPIYWYVQPTGGSQINLGPTYSSPILYSTTSYYLESKTGYSTDAVIGNGVVQNTTNNYPTPYGLWFTGSREQYLILASELITQGYQAGQIQSCGFNVITPTGAATSGAHLKNYTIKIGSTTQSALTTTYINGLTQVYYNTMYTDFVGWNLHQFTTPFVWDGVSNIVIEVCHDNYVSGADYGTNAVVNQTTTPFVSCAYNYADAPSQCSAIPTSTSTQRPNIRLISNVAGCLSTPRVPLTVTVSPQSSKDIGVTSIIAPTTGVNLTNHETVQVFITNFGYSPAFNFNVKFKVGNGAVISETVTDTILPNAVKVYTFQHTADLSIVTDTFKIKAFTNMTADATPLNDTTTVTVINNPPVYCTSSALYTYDEDIGNVTFAGINNGNPIPGYNNPAAVNLYTDYTNITPAQVTVGVSYPISIHMIYQYSAVGGTCKVYIDFNRNGTWEANEQAFSATYSDTTAITGTITIPINASPGLTRMRVVADEYNVAPACGTYSYGETEDYTINIIPPIPHDAGIVSIVKPGKYLTYSQSNSQQARLVIRNLGTDTLNQATVYYNLNGNLSTFNWSKTPALQSFAVDTFYIPNITLNDGTNILKAYVRITGDSNYYNDTTTIKIFKEHLAPIPYTDNFEVDKFWFPSDTLGGNTITNIWQQGTPASSIINSAHTPVNAWKTLLTKNYPVGNKSILYSPKFHISLTMGDTLKFWHWRQLGLQTYGLVEYTDFNGNWKPLGTVSDPNATNWFNSAGGWTGTGTGWEKSTYKISVLPDLGNYTQFRFTFDGSATLPSDTTHNGWAIDDFSISLMQYPLDAGILTINTPVSSSVVGDSIAPSVTVKNFGLTALTTFPVKYIVNNQLPTTETWVGSLAAGGSASYTFNHKFYVNPGNYTICAATTLTGDMFTLNDSVCNYVTVNPAANDVGIIKIISPSDSVPSSSTSHVTVLLKNFGTTPVTSVPVFYQRGALTPVSATWTGAPLNIGDTVSYTFATTFTVPIGNSFNLCAWTALANDAYPPNNKLCKSSTILGIEDIFNENDLWLGQNRPNPSNDVTIINYNLPQAGVINFSVTDLLGQVIMTKQIKENAGKHQIDVNVSNLPDGIYYYSIEYKGKRLVKKMMISK